jgi:excisionase family DNA binding protein
MREMTAEQEFMTPRDVAKLLGVSRERAYSLIQKGEIPGGHFAGAIRIPRKAWELWLEEKNAQALKRLGAQDDAR